MDDTTKYLIHARIAANGIVERSDVVGAVFGQTEGLLGDELDLRDLQQSSKVGRIDVEISSENGQSFGELTIATSLGKAETAILAASLETINRVGPCRADIEVTAIEDIRAAKRREIVDRAKELLATAFDETGVSGADLVDDVRDSARVADVVDYKGLPAGPRVESSDAVIVVEGRADVRQLLAYGIKNAIAVEGTDVPDAVADLTAERTTTVFVDGDRGGELILRELLQVGDVDFVAFAPPDQSVEDLSRAAVLDRLRQKVIADRLRGAPNVREAIADIIDETADERPRSADDHLPPDDEDTEVEVVPTSSPAASPSPPSDQPPTGTSSRVAAADAESNTNNEAVTAESAVDAAGAVDDTADADAATADADAAAPVSDDGATPPDAISDSPADAGSPTTPAVSDNADDDPDSAVDAEPSADDADESDDATNADDDAKPVTLRSHVEAVIDAETGTARLLDAEFGVITETEPAALIEAIEAADEPYALVLDGECSQRILDVAAQHGLDHIVAASTGEFVKKPIGTRVVTAAELQPPEPELEA
ncbi:DNA primase [Halonotius aquaticus]|uniref:DNA primase DnaG n=1 Tax=Halonotius aquaticus TaxID=2216978 RepID=A0A3A6PS89_9EURY|nr:DNA primase DnaG [Halonotius aquaticus]RJX42360.1 DNA primase [Halonotius aquaticus]